MKLVNLLLEFNMVSKMATGSSFLAGFQTCLSKCSKSGNQVSKHNFSGSNNLMKYITV